ncbi:M90 family metallopeptidase [Hydrogenimonas sp.]
MYYIGLFMVILSIAAVVGGWYAWRRLRLRRLWRRAERMPLSPEQAGALRRLPHYRVLPDDLKERLRPRMLFFVASKEFVGVKMAVTEEVKITIAFYACLMTAGMEKPECFDNLLTILVYPYDVVARRVEERGGVFEEGEFVLEGESSGDTVVIAWSEACREALHLWPHNVIVHELAHVLDFEDGVADGTPPLSASLHRRWSATLYRRFRELKEAALKNRDWGEYRLIGEYAATNEAEFFAVISELFFQRPLTLKRHFPDIYGLLKSFYDLDTAELFGHLEPISKIPIGGNGSQSVLSQGESRRA